MVKCICLDDQYKPDTIPDSMWIKEGEWYHITLVFFHTMQGIKGVHLKEVSITGCPPYETYRLDRFGFTEEGLQALIKLAIECKELDQVDIDIEKLIEESQLEIVEDER